MLKAAAYLACFVTSLSFVASGCNAREASEQAIPAAGGSSTGAGGSPGSGGSLGMAGSGATGPLPPLTRSCEVKQCTDFPAEPILAGSAPGDAATLFGEPSTTPPSGLCLLEPQDDTLLPANWIRPRFRFKPANGEDLFEIRLKAERQKHELVVYTTKTIWTMPEDIWKGLAQNTFDEPVTVTVRALKTSNPEMKTGATAKFTVAPVYAGGAMVYWAADAAYNQGGQSWLVGFSVGEEGTVDALTPGQIGEFPVLQEAGQAKPAETLGSVSYAEGKPRCIGCHSSTPDGRAVAFGDSWPWNIVLASIEEGSVGERPDGVTEAGVLMALQPWLGAPTFSPAHWSEGERIMVTSFGNAAGVGWSGASLNKTNQDRLAWFNLASPATVPSRAPLADVNSLNQSMQMLQGKDFGFIARNGDPRAAVNPTFSHDGKTIAYTSTSLTADGHAGGTEGTPVQSDIYLVPYNDRDGGDATGLPGAADAAALEYYPDFSADDVFVAFTRAAATTGRVYYRPDGEIYVVPAAGGMARRLRANDPAECGGEVSPGVINSWPKWSPSVGSANGKSYYWLIFSSGREYPEQFELPKDQYSPPDTRASQLYIAGLVVQGGQIISDHPAVYIWNQTKDTTNLTPAWDEFQIPPVVAK